MGKRATRRGMLAAAVAFMGCGCLPPDSIAASPAVTSPSSVTVTAGFVPNRLGAASTMDLGFRIHRPAGETPPPLVGVEFRLPAGVTLTTSELGLDTCDPVTLTSVGLKGCRPDAVMGYGNALIVAPDAAEPVLRADRPHRFDGAGQKSPYHAAVLRKWELPGDRPGAVLRRDARRIETVRGRSGYHDSTHIGATWRTRYNRGAHVCGHRLQRCDLLQERARRQGGIHPERLDRAFSLPHWRLPLQGYVEVRGWQHGIGVNQDALPVAWWSRQAQVAMSSEPRHDHGRQSLAAFGCLQCVPAAIHDGV